MAEKLNDEIAQMTGQIIVAVFAAMSVKQYLVILQEALIFHKLRYNSHITLQILISNITWENHM